MNNNTPSIPESSAGHFDFDGWQRLAESNPQAYFSARQAAIDAFIAAHPDSAHRLSELQDRIDATRVTAASPLLAAKQLSGMMHDHVQLLGHQLAVLQRETDRLCQGRVGQLALRRLAAGRKP